MKRTLLAAGLLLAFVPAVHAQYAATGGTGSGLPKAEQYKLRLAYRYFQPKLKGTMQNGEANTIVDLVDHLGFTDDSTWQADGTLQLKPGSIKLRGSYLKVDYGADVDLSTNIDYGNNFYARTTPLSSSLNGHYYGGELEYDIFKGSWGYLGATGGVRVLDVDTVVGSPVTGARNVDTVRSILPALGGTLRMYLGKRISVQGDFAGFSSGDRGKVWDAGASGHLHVSDHLSAVGGYRYISHTGHEDDIRIKLEMEGWQFGGEMSF